MYSILDEHSEKSNNISELLSSIIINLDPFY